MYNVATMSEKEKPKTEKKIYLSDEFSKDIKGRKRSSSWLAISSIIIVCVLVFGALGVGTYEIFFKPEKAEQKNSQEKIESRPQSEKEEEKKKESTQQSPAPTPQASAQAEEYTVVGGDTLGAIAEKFGTTTEKLKQANSIQDETLLQVGQKIKIVK